MREYYNYDRVRSGSHLVSSDYAVFTIDDTRSLIRDWSLQYQHRVEARFENGSHELFWLTGQAQGSAQATQMIGQGGLLHRIQPGGRGTLNKGRIATLQLEVSSSATASVGSVQEGLEFANVLSCDGAILQTVGWSGSAQGLELSQSVQILFASLRKEA